MASDCGVCARLNCGAGLIKEQWELHVAKMLCDISIAMDTIISTGIPIAPTSGEQVTYLPLARIAFGSVPALFAVALNDTHDKKYVNIYNGTNAAIAVSFDGGVTVHEVLYPSTALVYRHGENNNFDANTVWLKYDSVAPLAGEVTISAYY